MNPIQIIDLHYYNCGHYPEYVDLVHVQRTPVANELSSIKENQVAEKKFNSAVGIKSNAFVGLFALGVGLIAQLLKRV